MTTGTALRMQRERIGMSREALAEQLGVSNHLVTQWENDEARPDEPQARQLTEVLQISLDRLLEEHKEHEKHCICLMAPVEDFLRRHGVKAGKALLAFSILHVLLHLCLHVAPIALALLGVLKITG